MISFQFIEADWRYKNGYKRDDNAQGVNPTKPVSIIWRKNMIVIESRIYSDLGFNEIHGKFDICV